MLYGNYCYIFIENLPRKFSLCRWKKKENKPKIILDARYPHILKGEIFIHNIHLNFSGGTKPMNLKKKNKFFVTEFFSQKQSKKE